MSLLPDIGGKRVVLTVESLDLSTYTFGVDPGDPLLWLLHFLAARRLVMNAHFRVRLVHVRFQHEGIPPLRFESHLPSVNMAVPEREGTLQVRGKTRAR